MRNNPRIAPTLVFGTLSLAACAGGGSNVSSSIPASVPGVGNSSGSTSSAPPSTSGITPAVTTLGGPTFDGSNGTYASYVSFSGSATTLGLTPNSISAPSSDQSATLILKNNSAAGFKYQLIIPAANLYTNDLGTSVSASPGSPGYTLLWGLSYVLLGSWSGADDPEHKHRQIIGTGTESVYLFGYDTPASSMPTTGTAVYSGKTTFDIYQQSAGQVLWSPSSPSGGVANFSVDFASGKLSGTFTQMQYDAGNKTVITGTNGPWNDVSLNASIAAGTSKFSGTTAVTSTPQTTLSLKANATGRIDGGFYGPAAQQLGAIWSLTDGITTAVGGVAASTGH